MERPRRIILTVLVALLILSSLAMFSWGYYLNPRIQEARLRNDLSSLRKAIDQYAADRSALPQSLDDLAQAGYLGQIPVDPITQQPNWQAEWGEAIELKDSRPGIVDVHSQAEGKGSDGRSYADY